MLPTSNRLWLTDAKYLENKRAVLVCFSQLDLRRTKLMPFFPSFYVNKKAVEREELLETFSSENRQCFKLEGQQNAFRVTASTFTALNALANALFQATGFRATVLQPERQFLLSRGWSYFGCFHFFSETEFIGAESSGLPKVKLPLFSEPLQETVQQLLCFDTEAALKMLESIAASNTLRLPLNSLSPHTSAMAEAFFENIFWREGKSRHLRENPPASRGQGPLPNISDATVLDFTQLWPIILTRPFYNLGSETVDCRCCRPGSLQSRNLLPNTLALVEFLQDAFYFDSSSPGFAQRFHEENKGGESRLKRKREFCLPAVPVGPFNRGSSAAIPMHDALQLAASGKARVLAVQDMHWFCLKSESRIAKSIVGLQKKISLLEKQLEQGESAFFKKHGLCAVQLLNSDCDFLFSKARLLVLSKLAAALPRQLQNRESAFFSEGLGSALQSVEALVLSNFKSFAQRQACKTVLLQQGKAMVKSDRPMSLIQQFSEAQKIPALIRPKIAQKQAFLNSF